MSLQIVPLTEDNLADYERLTRHGDDGGDCYCAFWHMKWRNMDHYHAFKAEHPERLREAVVTRVRSGFHVGALAYEQGNLLAWISVAPLNEVFWCWRRMAALGSEKAAKAAAITCLTLVSDQRGKNRQKDVALALINYGRSHGWERIEAYPFDQAVACNNPKLAWPGLERPYANAGFRKADPHWLSQDPDFTRWIYVADLT